MQGPPRLLHLLSRWEASSQPHPGARVLYPEGQAGWGRPRDSTPPAHPEGQGLGVRTQVEGHSHLPGGQEPRKGWVAGPAPSGQHSLHHGPTLSRKHSFSRVFASRISTSKKRTAFLGFLIVLGGIGRGSPLRPKTGPRPWLVSRATTLTLRSMPAPLCPLQPEAPAAGRQPPPQTSPREVLWARPARSNSAAVLEGSPCLPWLRQLLCRCNPSGPTATARLNIKLLHTEPPRSHATDLLGGGTWGQPSKG